MMEIALEIAATLLVAITMALSLAHALELPGKMRLDREQYLAVQPIYYPGFTIGGAAEPLGTVAVAALLATIPVGTSRFWLIAGSLAALLVVQLIFWTMTQPVNRYWLQAQPLTGSARNFFDTGAAAEAPGDWRSMRDRWERSHVLRAVAAMSAFVLLVVAVAL
ncbi:anthrone oxygenase family protein [Sphingosinicella sp. CPCC 101087]|uniref:anthrone oxygenase family protein n=1 Tax=Sphingosinicella sp. CPCC 101087 TaxID=2497754 RepID=UPI0019816920|nr:DUF1772 domain-containing protein [Sphingosinicella sp. CPCC 101087]